MKQSKRSGRWMNFSRLIKSKFKSGGEVLSLLCWMVPQTLVVLHLEISSLAWNIRFPGMPWRIGCGKWWPFQHRVGFHSVYLGYIWKICPQSAFDRQENYCGNYRAERKKLKWKGWQGKLNELLSLPRVPGSCFSSCLPLRASLGSLASTKTVSNSPTGFMQKKVNKKMTGMLRTIFAWIL